MIDDSKNSPSMDLCEPSVQYGMSMGAIGVPYRFQPSLLASHMTLPSGSSDRATIRASYSGQGFLDS